MAIYHLQGEAKDTESPISMPPPRDKLKNIKHILDLFSHGALGAEKKIIFCFLKVRICTCNLLQLFLPPCEFQATLIAVCEVVKVLIFEH